MVSQMVHMITKWWGYRDTNELVSLFLVFNQINCSTVHEVQFLSIFPIILKNFPFFMGSSLFGNMLELCQFD